MRVRLTICASFLLGACATTNEPDAATTQAAAPAPVTSTIAPRLPFDPFARAEAGDWSLYLARGCMFEDGRLVHAIKGILLFELLPPDGDDDVSFRIRDDWRALDARAPFLADEFDRRSGSRAISAGQRGVAPALPDYLGGVLTDTFLTSGAWSSPETGQETYRTAQSQTFGEEGGHQHDCTKLTVHVDTHVSDADLIVWLSHDVRGLGLVALRDERTTDHVRTSLDLELIGHGTAYETRFGTPRELVMWGRD